MTPVKKQRICKKGHRYYKSSECPACPVCERERRPVNNFLSELSAPARRALEREVISSIQQLSAWSENDLLKLHGFGPSSLPKLRKVLAIEKLNFKN